MTHNLRFILLGIVLLLPSFARSQQTETGENAVPPPPANAAQGENGRQDAQQSTPNAASESAAKPAQEGASSPASQSPATSPTTKVENAGAATMPPKAEDGKQDSQEPAPKAKAEESGKPAQTAATPPTSSSAPTTTGENAGAAVAPPKTEDGKQAAQQPAPNAKAEESAKPAQEAATPAATQPPAAAPATPPPAAGESKASEALKASEQEKEKEKAKETASEAVEKGGLISGKFELSLTESYTHSSSNQLFIEGFGILPIVVVGDVSVETVRRDIFSTTLGVSYKLTDLTQVSFRVPYQYTIARASKATGINGKKAVTPNDERVAQASSLGDIGGGITYQLMAEGLNAPSLFAGLDFKARNGRDSFETSDPVARPPAGSGFYGIRGSLSASKSSAPAVVFGALSYGYNFPRKNIVYLGTSPPVMIKSYEPAANVSVSGGMSLSINYQLSLNFSFAQQFSYSSRLNGNVLPNSATNAITFRMGGIWRISDKTSVDLSMTAGLSPDAPDFTLALRLPWRY